MGGAVTLSGAEGRAALDSATACWSAVLSRGTVGTGAAHEQFGRLPRAHPLARLGRVVAAEARVAVAIETAVAGRGTGLTGAAGAPTHREFESTRKLSLAPHSRRSHDR